MITFTTYVMSGNTLDATKAFVSLTLFDMIRMPLALLPLLIVYIIEVKRKRKIRRWSLLWHFVYFYVDYLIN